MGNDVEQATYEAATSRVRVVFDGRTIAVHRRLARGLPWRTTRYGIKLVLGARLAWLGGEGERRRFDLYLCRTPTPRVPVAVGRNPHKGRARETESQWQRLEYEINQASARRIRAVLDATLGAGPWNDDTWQVAEQLAPELRVFTEWAVAVPPLQGSTPRTHREMIERLVLGRLRGKTGSSAASPCAWEGFAADDSALVRVQAEAWHNLVERLEYTADRS
ncbi:hypothetical protein [Streptomyces sp. 1222.5]|uniref:hypothetical protein n=1 Tax=Streptomyces sp. 1222.5 TaxID=1881026 RepID=UPI003EBCA171